MRKQRLVRITTVPMSLHYLLRGQLYFMNENGFEVIAISADGKERQDVVSEGIPHYIIPFTRKITPVRDLICLFKLILLIRKLKPEIVHTHTPKAGLLGMLASWICGVRVRLHTVAGLPMMETTGIKRWVLKMTERITYACAVRVYPNSKGLLEFMLKEFQISDFRFQIIGRGSSNGIDVSHFSRREELEKKAKAIREENKISDSAIVFCFIGRIVKDKGIKELIEAFKKLTTNRSDVYLLLVGPLEQELDPIPTDGLVFLQHHPHIVMAGFQPDVRPWLMAANIFVFPSYREGFPNVVMQAACMEVPCIVSDINGCNEIVEHEKTGLVISVKNSEALAEAMTRLSQHPDLRKLYAQQAREYVSQHFEQYEIWNAIKKEYDKHLVIL